MNNSGNSNSANRYGNDTQSGGGTPSGTPSGLNTQIQFNKLGTFGASSNLEFTNANELKVSGDIISTGGNIKGDVIGDVTGNLTGNLTGGVIGDVTGKILADDGTPILDNGTNGTDAQLVGDWKYNKIIDVNTPPVDKLIANCGYVNTIKDIAVEGLHVLKACKCATTVSITYPFKGIQTIDGVHLQKNDRVLVKNQTNNGQNNGIWVVRDHPHVWERASDFNTGTAQKGDFVFITNGLTNNAHGFVCTSFSFDSPLTSVWETFSGAGENAVILTGNSDNDICTVTGAHSIQGEDKLTFDGTTLNVKSTTASTGPTSGCAVFLGGVGIAKDLHVKLDIIASSSSDKRLKNNIKNIENPLKKLSKIGGYTFDWISKEGVHNNKGSDIGVIAQEVEEVLPEIVVTRDNGYKAVRYEKLVVLLIESNKELLKRVEVLESKIKELTN